MAKNDLKPVTPDMLDQFAVDAERVNEAASKTLLPRNSIFIALVGIRVSEPNEKSGDKHVLLDCAPIDYIATVKAPGDAVVPLPDAKFETHSIQFRIVGGKDKNGAQLTQEALDKAKKSAMEGNSAQVGYLLRASGTTEGASLKDVMKRIEDGHYPVGVWNPTTNGPDKSEPYESVKGSGNFDKAAKVQDFGEANFIANTPSSVKDILRAAVRRLEAVKQPVSNAAIAEVLQIPDLRRYAKTKGVAVRPGGNAGGGQGPGFSGMGDAPSDAE